MIAGLVYLFFTIAYFLFAFWIVKGLGRLRGLQRTEQTPTASVVIPARDEVENISYCIGALLKQNVPKESFDIIVVDDHSQDQTFQIAQKIADKFGRIKVLPAPAEDPRISPKKAALNLGISEAQGDVIFTLDADCSAPPQWISKILPLFGANVAAVASWVLIPDENALRSRVEFLDIFALQLIGAAAIGWDRPFLANGANLAFKKSVYQKVQGYQGFAGMGSGDDDLLIQKMHREKQGRILFAMDPDVAVTTFANKTWRDFFQQRIRWSSKGHLYPAWIRLTELSVFIYYLSLSLGIPLAFFLSFPAWIPLLALIMKWSIDYYLLRKGLKLIKRPLHFSAFLCASLFHLIYIPGVAILGDRGRFVWKGRKYRHGHLENPATHMDETKKV